MRKNYCTNILAPLKLHATPPTPSSTYHVHVPQPPTHYVLCLLCPDLLDPDERVVKFWIYGLQIFESQRFIQDTLVEGQGETCVDEFAVEQSLEWKYKVVRWHDPSFFGIAYSSKGHSKTCVGKQCRYHGNEAPNELEVLEVIRVDVGGGVDLQAVVVLASILK